MAFTPVNDGDLAVAPQLQQLLDALQGVSGAGQPIDLTSLDSATEVALTVRNLGAGGALQVLSTAGAELLFVDDAGVTFGGTIAFTDINAANATLSGNLALSGVGKRITGDFTNATRSSRVLFQTATANSTTNVGAIPSGSGTIGAFSAFNNAAPDSATVQMVIEAIAGEGALVCASPGGSYQPMTFYTSAIKQMTLSTSGGLTLHNGGLTVTTGGVTLTAGNLAVSSGTLTASGTITSSGGSIATANGSINTAGAISGSSLSVTGQVAGATVVSTSGAITAANGITATAGNLTVSAGSMTSSGDIRTSGGGLNVGTSGATPGQIKSSGNVTVGNGLTVTTGGATISAGDLSVVSGAVAAATTLSAGGAITTSGGGINAATTGAAAGEVKTSSHAKIGGLIYPSYNAQQSQSLQAAGPLTVAAGSTTTLAAATSQGYYSITDAASGDGCIVYVSSGAHDVGQVYARNFAAGTWNVNSDAGSTWAVYWDGANYSIKNRTGVSRANLYWQRIAGF